MNIKTFTTKNGFHSMIVEKESPIALLLFLVKTGSRYENEKESGISHFIEHMMFKPTKNRASAKIINTEIEGIGGMTNAFTAQEYTGYYIQVLKEKFEHSFEILSDLLQNGLLPESDIKIEKGNVIEEINMYDDSPSELVWEISQATNFPDSALGRPILGTKETVESFSADDIRKYIKQKYTQDDFLIVAAGDVNQEEIDNLANKYLEKRTSGKNQFEPTNFAPKEKITFHKKSDVKQAHTVLSFPGISTFDKDYYKYLVANNVLGGGMGSILFDVIREQLGVAYYVGSTLSDYEDTGTLQVYFGTNLEKFKETYDRVNIELKKFKSEKIDDADLKRAQNYIYGYLAQKHESIGFLGQSYGLTYLIEDRIETLEEKQKKIFEVTIDDICEVANKVFGDNSNLTYIANKELI